MKRQVTLVCLVVLALYFGSASASVFDPLYLSLMKTGNFVGNRTCQGNGTFWAAFFIPGPGETWQDTETQYIRGFAGDARTIVDTTIHNRSVCSDKKFNFFYLKDTSQLDSSSKVYLFANGQLIKTITNSDFGKYTFVGVSIDKYFSTIVQFPTTSPSAAPSAAPSFSPTQSCISPSQWFGINIDLSSGGVPVYDYDSPNVKWNLFKLNSGGTGVDVLSGDDVNNKLDHSICLAPGRYAITVVDCSGGDEFVKNNGSYTLSLDNTDIKYKTGFNRSDVTSFTISDDPPCPSGQSKFKVNITPDNKPSESSWELIKLGASFSEKVTSSSVSQTICLPSGKYVWDIYDTAGDGICCSNGNGHYSLYLDGSKVDEGGAFRYFKAYSFVIN